MTPASENHPAATPYTAPVASLAGEGRPSPGRSTLLLVANWLLFAVALLVAIIAQLVVPAFSELLPVFGADVPTLTGLFFSFTPLCFLLPLLLLIPALWITLTREHTPAFRSRMVWISAGSLLLILAVVGLSIYALYLPVFQMDHVYLRVVPANQ